MQDDYSNRVVREKGNCRENPCGGQVEGLADTILDSLSAHIAILDENGWIVKTNKAWKEFARSNNSHPPSEDLPVNYLAVCEQASGESSEHSHEIAKGIRSVIQGELEEFVHDYACHSTNEKRWFYMRARRLQDSGPLRVVISHENVTPLKLAEEELQEANSALRVLLKQRDRDRQEVEDNVIENIQQGVLPFVSELVQTPLEQRQKKLLQYMQQELQNIVSPFIRNLNQYHASLTPQEIKVASLIRQGLSSKEIAETLQCSEHAVQFHRKNLRGKFGLKNKGKSLFTYLNSLSERED